MTSPTDRDEKDDDLDLTKETLVDLDAPEEAADAAKGGRAMDSESSCDCGHE